MPLVWSEEQQPNEKSSYTHVVSDTPLGSLLIEWKGWKHYDSPMCETPWGQFIAGNDVGDAKAQVQKAWDEMAARVAALTDRSAVGRKVLETSRVIAQGYRDPLPPVAADFDPVKAEACAIAANNTGYFILQTLGFSHDEIRALTADQGQ